MGHVVKPLPHLVMFPKHVCVTLRQVLGGIKQQERGNAGSNGSSKGGAGQPLRVWRVTSESSGPPGLDTLTERQKVVLVRDGIRVRRGAVAHAVARVNGEDVGHSRRKRGSVPVASGVGRGGKHEDAFRVSLADGASDQIAAGGFLFVAEGHGDDIDVPHRYCMADGLG